MEEHQCLIFGRLFHRESLTLIELFAASVQLLKFEIKEPLNKEEIRLTKTPAIMLIRHENICRGSYRLS